MFKCNKASVPLLLRKIGEDLEHLKKSLNIVRENPEYMAHQFVLIGIQNLINGVFEEVNIFHKLSWLKIVFRHSTISKKLMKKRQEVFICLRHLKAYLAVSKSRFLQAQ